MTLSAPSPSTNSRERCDSEVRSSFDKSSNCTRLVEKLRQKRYLKREVCENSRRQVDITILDKGLALLKKVDAETESWLNTLKNITKSEAQELNRILDKLRG